MREIWPSEVSENFRIENSSKFEFKPRSGLGGKFPAQDPGRLGGRLGSRPPPDQVDWVVDLGVDLPRISRSKAEFISAYLDRFLDQIRDSNPI